MNKDKRIPIKTKRTHQKAPDFKSYYVTGAIGGFRNPYDFRLTFYQDDINTAVIKKNEILQNQDLNEKEIEEVISNIEIPFYLKCEVIMTELAARELYNFLGKELESLKEIKEDIERLKRE